MWIILIVIDVAIMMKMWNIARSNQCVRGLASFVEAMNYNDSNPKRHFYEHDEKSLTVYSFSWRIMHYKRKRNKLYFQTNIKLYFLYCE